MINSITLNKSDYTICATRKDNLLSLVDYYFVIVVYLFPNMFLGFVYRKWFVDERLIEIILPLPLLFLYRDNEENKTTNPPGWTPLRILCIYIISQFLITLALCEDSFIDIIKTMRWNIPFPISAYCILHAAIRMKYSKLEKIFSIFMNLFFLQCILCFISAMINYDFFINRLDYEGYADLLLNERVHRGNTLAFPRHFLALFTVATITALSSRRLKIFARFIVALCVPIIMTRRMLSICTILECLIIWGLSSIYLKTRKVGYIIYIALFIFTIMIINPKLENQILLKITPDHIEKGDSFVKNYGTYNYRLTIFNDSVSQVEGRHFFGNHYIRDEVGKFSEGYTYVLGEDSPIAAIIFCEGFVGIILRLAPYLFFLAWAFRKIKDGDEFEKKLSIIFLAYTLSQIPSYIQSMILTRFDYNYCIFALLYIINGKRKSIQNSIPSLESVAAQ